MTPWTVTVHALSKRELLDFKAERPGVFLAICATMMTLAAETDPRYPVVGLDVCEIKHDAPGWFRVRVVGENVRVVFRLLERRDGKIVEVHVGEKPDPQAAERAIQIMRAAHRADVYGRALIERHLDAYKV